jgi:hypothetical protein
VKVRVAPGEAYIAPTDNVIHDASTVGSQTPSITLTLRGWFTVPPCRLAVPDKAAQ